MIPVHRPSDTQTHQTATNTSNGRAPLNWQHFLLQCSYLFCYVSRLFVCFISIYDVLSPILYTIRIHQSYIYVYTDTHIIFYTSNYYYVLGSFAFILIYSFLYIHSYIYIQLPRWHHLFESTTQSLKIPHFKSR